MIQDGGRQSIVLHEEKGVLERVGGRQRSAGVFESQCEVHDNKGLVFDDQDRAPLKGRTFHVRSLFSAAKRNCPALLYVSGNELGRLTLGCNEAPFTVEAALEGKHAQIPI